MLKKVICLYFCLELVKAQHQKIPRLEHIENNATDSSLSSRTRLDLSPGIFRLKKFEGDVEKSELDFLVLDDDPSPQSEYRNFTILMDNDLGNYSGEENFTLIREVDHGTYSGDENFTLFREVDHGTYGGDENFTIIMDDMLFTQESYKNWVFLQRAYLKHPYNQWYRDSAGNPVIPYIIDSSVLSSDVEWVLKGIQQWGNTCIRFIDNTKYNLKYYLRIQRPSTAGLCNSFLGNIYARGSGQPLNLGEGCYDPNVIAHEIGHAIGLSHEHNRVDRDKHLKVFKGNIASGYEGNFGINPWYFTTLETPYCYASVMHYHWNAFGTDYKSPTVLPIDPTKQIILSRNNPVSHYDSLLVNRAFQCSSIWSRRCSDPPSCTNHGYLDKKCRCVCPLGTKGKSCETVTTPFLPHYDLTEYTFYKCGGNITKAISGITVPEFKASWPARTAQADCFWWIQKPVSAKVAKVRFTAFDMFKKYKDGSCFYEWLEVRTDSLYLADDSRKCANDYRPESVIKSTGDIVLWFHSRVYRGGNTGFKFDVSFQ